MKKTIVNLTVVAALSFTHCAFGAGEVESKTPPASPPAAAASAVAAPIAAPETTPAAPAQKAEKAEAVAKPSTSVRRTKARTERPKNLDLRHCLELESNAAIAKCAGED